MEFIFPWLKSGWHNTIEKIEISIQSRRYLPKAVHVVMNDEVAKMRGANERGRAGRGDALPKGWNTAADEMCGAFSKSSTTH